MGATTHPPLKFGVKIGYASGQLIEGVINNVLSVFLLFYLTTACGLSGGLAGAALSVGLIVDAVMDPLIGSLSDGWRSRFGRRLPFMVVGLVPMTVSFLLLFSLPAGLSQTALACWVAALHIVMRVSMSLVVLPYQAVGAELSDDYVERSSLMSWRWGIGQIGAFLVMILGFGVFLKNGLANRLAYTPFAFSLAAIFLFGALLAIRMIWVTRSRQHPPTSGEGPVGLRAFREMTEAFRNPSFRVLFVGALIFFVAIGVYAALAIHANTFFWKLQADQTQQVTLALFGGLLFGAPLAGPLLARFEKATVLVIGMVGLGLAQTVPFLLRFAGLLPQTGQSLTLILAAIMLVGGALMAAAAIAFMSMIADATDEHEHLFGARREALFFAGWAFANKAATGIGALVSGVILQIIHFPTDLAQHGGLNAALPTTMTDQLAWFTGPGTGLLSIVAALVNLGYRLDRKKHAAILADLALRKGGAP
jgi:GPH family glycoside/pentoside/hexuronide:cation symporter